MVLSVIIPTYNRRDSLIECLQALKGQTLNEAWEVIIVNDGGEKADLENLERDFQTSLKVRLYHQKNGGPAAARNHGAGYAKGEFLAFLDDDCLPAPTWLGQLFSHVKKGLMVGGYTQNLLTENLYSEASQQLISYLYQTFSNTPWYFFTSNNLMIHHSDFKELSGFDTRFKAAAGEDRAFCLEWLTSGRTMKYVEEALINHQHHLTFRTFWRQHFTYGLAAKAYKRLLHGKGLKLRPSLSFYLGLIAHLSKRPANFRKKLVLLMLLILTQLATFFGYKMSGS